MIECHGLLDINRLAGCGARGFIAKDALSGQALIELIEVRE